MLFKDRVEAGIMLAEALKGHAGHSPMILAIPRGGITVAHEVYKRLGGTLDIVVPRKISAEQDPELALGAVAEDGSRYLDRNVVSMLGASEEYIERKAAEQMAEISRRMKKYREGLGPRVIKGRYVIVVDDGIATGYTAMAALKFVRKQSPKRLVLAVPVAPAEVLEALRKEADEVVCLYSPEVFFAIGSFYQDFDQVQDGEVIRILKEDNNVV